MILSKKIYNPKMAIMLIKSKNGNERTILNNNDNRNANGQNQSSQ